nr:MAG TPA: hypothetical protein [Caudoviricetes sp.]
MSDFGHCFGGWANWGSLFWCPPAENTVAVCDTISRMPKMSPVRINRDTIRRRSLLLKNERKYYLPKMKDRFRFSFWGSEKTWLFPHLCGICGRTNKKAIA